jgi:serine/threonine protein kinase
VKILDFGIAKETALETGSVIASATGTLIGSPLFMSPEQIRGEAVDHRSDLWSLGVVIYRMLTGSEPFLDEHVGRLFEAICRGETLPPSHRAPELGPAIDAFMTRALARARTMRFQSAAELSAALAAAVAGEPLPASHTNAANARHTMSVSDMPSPQPHGWTSGASQGMPAELFQSARAEHPAAASSVSAQPLAPSAYPMAMSGPPPAFHPTPQQWSASHTHAPPRAPRWPWAVAAVGVLALAASVVMLVVAPGREEGETPSTPKVRNLGAPPPVSPADSGAATASVKPDSVTSAPRPTVRTPPPEVTAPPPPKSGRNPPLGVVHTCWKGNEGFVSGTPASSATISAFVDANGRATTIRVEGPARQHKKFLACTITRLSETNWGKGEHETMSFSVSLPPGSPG